MKYRSWLHGWSSNTYSSKRRQEHHHASPNWWWFINVAIFHGGKIRHTGSLPFAGGHVTNDIVHGLQVTQQDAEKLKQRHGAAYEPLVPESDVIELPSTPGQGSRSAHRRVLAHIMHARIQEMLEFANDEIARAGYQQRLPAGVVLTGGGALAPGVVELGREVFAMPVRIGTAGPGADRPYRQRRVSPVRGARRARALRGQAVVAG